MFFKKQTAVVLALLIAVLSLGLSGCKKDNGWKGSTSKKGETAETTETAGTTETTGNAGTETAGTTETTGGKTETEPQTETDPMMTEPRYLTFTADEASTLIMQSLTLSVNINDVTDEDYLEDEYILDSMGWCQAMIQLMFSRDYLTETEALAYQAAIGGHPGVLVEIPEEWKNEGLCVFGTDKNGEWTVSFPQHYAYLEEIMGISVAFETEPCDDGSLVSRLKYYVDDGESYSFVSCHFIFEEADGIFPCKIREFKTVSGFDGLDINGGVWGDGDWGENDPYTGGNSQCDLTLIGGSLDYVMEQNFLGNYFESADTITMRCAYPDSGAEALTEFFIWNGRYAAVDSYLENTGEKRISSWHIPNMTFWNDEDGHVVGNLDFRGYIEGSGMEMEAEIAYYCLYYGEVSSCVDCGETIRLTIENRYADEYYGWDEYILDKGTLHIIRVNTFDEYGSIVCSTVVTTGDEFDHSDIFSAWDSTRTVTFIYNELQMDDSVLTTELTLEVPDTYELLPYVDEYMNLYMDEGYTMPYEYPGDGVDYTVYMTNISG